MRRTEFVRTFVVLAIAAVVGGCAPGTSDRPDVTIKANVQGERVSVEGDGVDPRLRVAEVDRGQVVRLVVRSDHRTEVDVHGYGLQRPAGPRAPAVFTFTADRPGLFKVETHDPPRLIVQLQVS